MAAWAKLAPHVDLSLGAALAPAGPEDAAAEGAAPRPTAAAALAAADSERLMRATRAMQLGDWRAAAALLGKELIEKPGDWLALDLRAACWLHAGRHEQALDDALRCTGLAPDWARGWARLGAAQLCLEHPRAAAAAYRRGLQLDGGSREMQLGLELAQAALVPAAGRRKAMHH